MLTHAEIWQALDHLADSHGLSPSALARRSGLDPTTFNRSKRRSSEGKLRWPSTESLAKVLGATGSSLADLVNLINPSQGLQRVPIIGYAEAGSDGYFDDVGYPMGAGWDYVVFAGLGDPHAYALEISGMSMAPVYRDGDTIIVSPQAAPRRGDRVVLRTREGEVMAKQLARATATRIELSSINPDYPDRSFAVEDVAWMARVIWASQ